jgi:signal transduction histidine kinase
MRLVSKSAESGAQSTLHARELILMASHDIRSPLAAIRMSADGIERRRRKGESISTGEWALTMTRIRRATDSAFALIDDLLSVERLQDHAGTRVPKEPSRPVVDVIEVIEEAIALQRDALERARCKVTVHREEGLTPRGSWDGGYLLSIFSNLLQNASRHAPGAAVRITLFRRRDRLGIRFADHGPGFAAPCSPRGQTFEAETPTMGSLGLGLWIVRRAIASLQGSLDIETSPGAGATFEIELPGLLPEPPGGRSSVARLDDKSMSRMSQAVPRSRLPPRRADLESYAKEGPFPGRRSPLT